MAYPPPGPGYPPGNVSGYPPPGYPPQPGGGYPPGNTVVSFCICILFVVHCG